MTSYFITPTAIGDFSTVAVGDTVRIHDQAERKTYAFAVKAKTDYPTHDKVCEWVRTLEGTATAYAISGETEEPWVVFVTDEVKTTHQRRWFAEGSWSATIAKGLAIVMTTIVPVVMTMAWLYYHAD